MTALNAKYIHSSLAIRSIKKYCDEFKDYISIAEFTINNEIDYIVSEIYKLKPDVLCFSCYIWNINQIIDIISDIKKILPNIKIVLGGPEVSFEYEYLFDKNANIIIIGEGEQTFKELAEMFIYENIKIDNIKGIAYKKDDKIIVTEKRNLIKLDDIPFVYYDYIEEFENKIIYYEASRGCPYNCQYCLSSVEQGVRFLSLDRVFNDLKFFLDKKVKQVKFVDRTFNCNKNFASSIWNFLIENDNKITNFHFEISADMLNDNIIKLLSEARKGLFQFEIGIQTTNLNTLEDIRRNSSLEKIFENFLKIKLNKNIHQHLDLIAGLPNEDYASFKKSFNDVYNLYPEQLQLGFLKLLRGSGLRKNAEKFGIVYRNKSPYEVLYTKDISYDEIIRLKKIEELVEIYYNSGKSIFTLRYITKMFKTPFDFFEKFSYYWEKNNYYSVLHNKVKVYLIIFEFCKCFADNIEFLKDIVKFDMFLNDNIKNFPDYIQHKEIEKDKLKTFFESKENLNKYFYDFNEYTPKQISRMCHLENFNYNIIKWIESGFYKIEKQSSYILFIYRTSRESFFGNSNFYNINL